jgi:hypothetical protein
MEITKNEKPKPVDFLLIYKSRPWPVDFLLEITKIWQKPERFWIADFFLFEILKIHRLVWIFASFESV